MRNPYASSNGPLDIQVERRLPHHLSRRTRRVVCGFALFELFAWMVVAYWNDYLYLDLIAVLIAINGTFIDEKSCRRFPWTILMCLFYPVAITFRATQIDLSIIANWLPGPHSPVLSLQLLVAICSSIAAASLLRCYIYQNRRHPTLS